MLNGSIVSSVNKRSTIQLKIVLECSFLYFVVVKESSLFFCSVPHLCLPGIYVYEDEMYAETLDSSTKYKYSDYQRC